MSLLLTSSAHSAPRAVLPITAGRTFHTREPGVEFLPSFAALCSEGKQPASVSSSLQSGSARRASLNERPVFIICREALRLLSAPVLKRSNPHTLAGGHEAHRSLFQKYPHVSSLSLRMTLPRFTFQR
jgi:hypothetical protein